MKKIFAIFVLSFLFVTNIALAQSGKSDNKTPTSVSITNPLAAGGIDSFQTLIGRAINSILGVVGSLALVMFVYGGLLWMTSGGSNEQVKKGRDILIWATVGLVIIFSAYGLVRFVIQGVGAA
ncbi:MAG TPA: pilin [bacterium]|jgi:hypothetical protein|nr:pilin [bacterium]HOD87066.1 pilin [bacterium]HQB76348.1 pilin [bacterium]HQL34521.1 pilin [bacterium]